jgi:hypothetical protein
MTKRAIALVILAVGLAAVGVWRAGWFQKGEIKILPQIRPPLRGNRTMPNNSDVYPVTFAFDRKYQFTEIRVVALDDEKTNKFPHAVWHMISDSNSVPTKALVYGAMVRGMKPKVPRAQAEALEPNVPYLLYVRGVDPERRGEATGKAKFQTHELVRPEN